MQPIQVAAAEEPTQTKIRCQIAAVWKQPEGKERAIQKRSVKLGTKGAVPAAKKKEKKEKKVSVPSRSGMTGRRETGGEDGSCRKVRPARMTGKKNKPPPNGSIVRKEGSRNGKKAKRALSRQVEARIQTATKKRKLAQQYSGK